MNSPSNSPGAITVAGLSRYVSKILVASLVLMLVGCVTDAYAPQQGATQSMDVLDARQLIKSSLLNIPNVGGRATLWSGDVKVGMITNVRFTSARFRATTDDGKTIAFDLKNMHISVVPEVGEYGALLSAYHYYLVITEQYRIYFGDELSAVTVNHIADAFEALKIAALSGDTSEDQALFDAAVKSYQAESVKPSLPEAARRFAVQAKGAIDDKQFDVAADLYKQALEIAPWWPNGHFDRAIVLSETDEFSEAIMEMKCYLALVPDAPNARAAQDKIYDWERKAQSNTQ